MDISHKKFIGLSSISYIIFIVLINMLPLNNSSVNLDSFKVGSIKLEHLIHFFLYLPSIFFIFQLLPFVSSFLLKYRLRLSIFLSLAFSIMSELIQIFLSYRSFSMNDLISNFFGAIIGSVLFIILKSIFNGKFRTSKILSKYLL